MVALEAAVFVVLMTTAVVVGRGGSVARLLTGHVREALNLPQLVVTAALSAQNVRVFQRSTQAGQPFAVVTGEVMHRGPTPVTSVRVDVTFDGQPQRSSGWGWSDVSAIDVADVADTSALTALSMRAPKSTTVAPGDSAPFVVLAPLPPNAARVHIDLVTP